jgi:hypothetical protein
MIAALVLLPTSLLRGGRGRFGMRASGTNRHL